MKEKKKKPEQGIEAKAVWLFKALLCSFVVTGILLLLLTLLLYKLDLDEGKVAVGIIAIYVLSTFVGGFVVGKLSGTRKFLWGLAAGILYFVLLLLVSVGVYHSLQGNAANLLTTLLLCAGGGMLGGMVS